MATTTTLTVHVEGMHCASCGLFIDEQLEELDGLLSSRTSVRRGTTTVTIDAGRCSPAAVTDAITAAGYTAQVSQQT